MWQIPKLAQADKIASFPNDQIHSEIFTKNNPTYLPGYRCSAV